MNERRSHLFSGAKTAAYGLVLTLGLVSTASASEWIVRFREPRGLARVAQLTALKSESAPRVDLLNESEALARFKFESDHDALSALAPLQASGEVVSVTANHYYRPAVVYRSKVVEEIGAAASRPLSVWDALVDLVTPRKPAKPKSPRAPKHPGNPATAPEVELPGAVQAGVDPLVERDWAIQAIRLPDLAELGAEAAPASVIAAVIDTGVDYNHEDLGGAMWRKPGNAREVGYDFAHGHARPYDLVHFDVEGCMKDATCRLGTHQEKFMSNPGHGTHCAGHVGAVANNSLGLRGVGAVAGKSSTQVMALKFFYDAGEAHEGAGDDGAAIQSIDYAIRNGAKVISASWGGHMPRASAEASELKQALVRAQKAGVLVVIAAGNESMDQDSPTEDAPSYPAAYELDNLIVVAATDAQDELAEFSNYGARTVHLAAPGVKILSTTAGGRYADVIARFKDPQDPRGPTRELAWDGTSMATPIVAGAVALVWSRHPAESYAQIRARILKGVRRVPGLAGKVATGGVLDVAASLR